MKRNKILFIIGLSFLLLLVLASTYAYFQINIINSTTNSSVMGTTNKYGTATFTTNTSKLYLKLTNDEMSEDYIGTTYYANSDTSGTPLTTNPNYTLATASLADGDLPLDCTYNFKVTATVTKAITDGSDSDVKITIGNTTKTLKELTDSGTNGLIITGTIKNLVTGENQSLNLSSTLVNTTSNQSGLSGNSYTITISPYTSGDTKAFACKLHEDTLADKLIASGNLWQSGLEGDGYRYVGSGAVGDSTNPNNFICFGTTSKSDCTTNQDKYMYRILGVFPDSNGEQHVKLIKYKQLGKYAWHSDRTVDTSWENSDMYKGLNGEYFLTNSDFDYLQNNTWLNKIANWTWSAVNTKTYEDETNNPNYIYSTTKGIYLNEMHKTSSETLCKNSRETAINCNGGEWTTPNAKIGLMYVSDYALSLGSSALALTVSTNYSTLKTGWMNQSNNDTTKYTNEWTLSRYGDNGSSFYAWYVDGTGFVRGGYVDSASGLRPTFYLNSTEKLNSGTGSLDDPFIIQ